MDSSKKTTVKLSRKVDLKGVYTVHTCYTSSILSGILKENFQKPVHWIFCFFSYSCWIKFELIHFCKNVKSTLTLSINIRLKVTRVFCILISNVIN